MLKIGRITLVTLILTVAVAGGVLAAWETRTDEKTITVESNETTQGDLWCLADTVLIDGTVDGDLLVKAARLVINGEVKGDVIGMVSSSVVLSGRIGGDLRLLGGVVIPTANISLNGPVKGNISLISKSVTMGKRSSASGLWGAGETLKMNGKILGDIRFNGEEAYLGGKVTGKSTINAAQRLVVQPGASLNELYYYQKPPQVGKSATVGSMKKLELPQTGSRYSISPLTWLWFIGTLLMGFVLINLFPGKTALWIQGILFWPRTLLLGVLLLFGIPFVGIFLAVTIVGIPLAFLLLLCWAAALLVSQLPCYLYLGGAVIRLMRIERRFTPGFLLIIGGIITTFLTTLPYIGWFLALLVTAFGLGLLVQKPPVIIFPRETGGTPPPNP